MGCDSVSSDGIVVVLIGVAAGLAAGVFVAEGGPAEYGTAIEVGLSVATGAGFLTYFALNGFSLGGTIVNGVAGIFESAWCAVSNNL